MGCTTRQRARPFRFSVNFDGRMAEVELANTASARPGVEPREHVALDVDHLRGVFLHVGRRRQGPPRAARPRIRPHRRRPGTVQKIMASQIRQHPSI